MKRSVVIWVILGLFSLTWAQLDPKAAPFLSYSSALQNMDKPETLVYTLCLTIYSEGETLPEVCTRSAIDYVNRRIAIRTTAKEDPDYNNQTIYQNGHIRMTDFLTGKPTTLPPAQARPLEAMLENMFEQAFQGTFMPDEFERTSYGEIIQGEQVSATLKLPSFEPESPTPKKTTVRLIFGRNKELLGTITTTPQGELLSVVTRPQVEMTFAQVFNTTLYLLENGAPMLTSKNRLVQFRLNKPLDEKLFTFAP